jgi:hypothetical protein
MRRPRDLHEGAGEKVLLAAKGYFRRCPHLSASPVAFPTTDARNSAQAPAAVALVLPSPPMAYAPPRKRRASPGAIADRRSRRRALELLAGCGPEGWSEAVMLANGIDVDTMVEIIVEGLALATPQRTRAGLEVLEVAVLRISEKGRKALAG